MEQKISKGWMESKKRANYPTLRDPKVVDEFEGGAAFNFAKGETIIGEKHIKDYAATGIVNEEEVIVGTFDHEIIHYMVWPKNLANLIKHGHFSEKVFEKKANTILQLHMDMVVDTHNTLKSTTRKDVLKMREATVKNIEQELAKTKDPIEKITLEASRQVRGINLEYLCRQAEVDGFKSEHPKIVEEMMEVDFSRNANHEIGLYRYGSLIKDLIPEITIVGMGYDGNGKPFQEIIGEASKKQINEALRELMKEMGKEQYEEIKKWVKDLRGEPQDTPKGQQAGTAINDLDIDKDTSRYYFELSKMYPLVITKRPRKSTDEEQKFGSTEKWRPGKDTSLILPQSSGGLILPGLTKSIKLDKAYKKTIKYQEPNALELIDTSGSMPNPKHSKSYAVLGAGIVARSYHSRGRYVGVVNFDAQASILPFTRDINLVFDYITAYKGGGTTVNLEVVKKMLDKPQDFLRGLSTDTVKEYVKAGLLPKEVMQKQVSLDVRALEEFVDRKIDVYMFTDGDIGNQEEVLQYLSNLENLNRAAIILTNGEREQYEKYNDKIHLITVKDEEDLPRIAVKEMGRSLHGNK